MNKSSNSQQRSVFSSFDTAMMAKALSLAEQGIYSTQPNPHVGCVIVDSEQNVVGEGYHEKAGEAHAEINALNGASELSKGACAYVTLEPCAHTGRTGPCAEALIKAGVSRVVIASKDPNPLVAGKGIQILKDAGVIVELGLMQGEAEALNEPFFFRLRYHRPFITLKLAASLDGKTALSNGESKWITSDVARKDVQVHRAKACAILSGSGTIIADNPRLNVREDELPYNIAMQFAKRREQPKRFVIDGKNQLDTGDHKVFNDGHPTLVYNLKPNVNIKAEQQQQVDSVHCNKREVVNLNAVFNDMAKREINHLWVEAGAELSGALLDAGFVNELILYQAPKFLGDTARGLANIKSTTLLKNALTGSIVSVNKIGPDIKTVLRF